MTESEKIATARRADSAVVARDFQMATRLYKSILKEFPRDIETLEKLGAMLIKSGDDANALEIYKKIAALNQNKAETLIILGGIYRRLKRYDESVAILESAVASGNSNSEVYYNLGFTYKLMGNYDSAIECFNNVIEENPKDVLAYNHLGAIYSQKGDYASAVSSYNHGLKIDHNHPILHFNLAETYEKMGKIESALSSYEAALKAKPLWTEAIEKYSDLLLKTNRIDTAFDLVDNAVKLSPEDSKMHTQMGAVYEKQYDWENAKHEFKEAVKYDEGNIKAIRSLAATQENLGEYNDSAETMENLAKNNPENFDITRQYVGSLLSANYLDTAKNEIDELIKKDEKNLENLNLLAQYYICSGDDAKTDETFKEIERKSPTFKNHIKDAGIRSNRIGKTQKAKNYLEQFLENHPDDAKAVFEMAKACESLNDFSHALHFYNRASNLQKYNVAAKKKVSHVRTKVTDREAEAILRNTSHAFDENAFRAASLPETDMGSMGGFGGDGDFSKFGQYEVPNDLSFSGDPIERAEESTGDMIGMETPVNTVVVEASEEEEPVKMDLNSSMDNLLEREDDPFKNAISGEDDLRGMDDFLVEPEEEYPEEEEPQKMQIDPFDSGKSNMFEPRENFPRQPDYPQYQQPQYPPQDYPPPPPPPPPLQPEPPKENLQDKLEIPPELLNAALKALAKEVEEKEKVPEPEPEPEPEPIIEPEVEPEPIIEPEVEPEPEVEIVDSEEEAIVESEAEPEIEYVAPDSEEAIEDSEPEIEYVDPDTEDEIIDSENVIEEESEPEIEIVEPEEAPIVETETAPEIEEETILPESETIELDDDQLNFLNQEEILAEDEVELPTTTEEILDLFKKLRDLCDYLPERKREYFLNSDASAKIEYVIDRLEIEKLEKLGSLE